MGILRSIFGPSKDEIWGQLAKDIGGYYEDGGFFLKDVLRYRSGQWEITLDTYTESSGKYSTLYTRMRAPFVNKDGLYFKIYREGFLTTIGKALGLQDINIDDSYFDDSFIIQGNQPEKIKQLLADKNLKELIQKQPDICLEIKDNEGWFGAQFPRGVDELHFKCNGVLKNEAMLKDLFDLFCITLQRLVQIDSAYENDPNVRL